MKTAFVVCSRTDSRRIFKKPLIEIEGKPVLEHLITRIQKTGFATIVAVPEHQEFEYRPLYKKMKFSLETGPTHDPMLRMFQAAKKYKLGAIIRVCHDKIFVDPETVKRAVIEFKKRQLDYLYSSSFTDGSSFEIISFHALERAINRYKNIEHISYAIKSVSPKEKILDFDIPENLQSDARLLIDYPDDIELMSVLMASLDSDSCLEDAIKFAEKNKWITRINSLPTVTIYSCAYNASKYLDEALDSIEEQDMFKMGAAELILVDDHSDDDTYMKLARFRSMYPDRVTLIRNSSNLGLSTSSNIALDNARGKYLIRLDADDYFSETHSVSDLLEMIEKDKKDIIYPANHFGEIGKIQMGNECHHVGGALFNQKALNHVRFTDGLRNYEGLDLFNRAKKVLDIGYSEYPCFFYRQHEESMSKTNLEERRETLDKIEGNNGEKMGSDRSLEAERSIQQ